jgi:hypothetical protein
MTRHGRSPLICRRLAKAVAMVAPAGLGYWPRAWELVEEPSRQFLDALDEWVCGGTADARAELQMAADAVVAAWFSAAAEWEQLGQAADSPAAESRGEVTLIGIGMDGA